MVLESEYVEEHEIDISWRQSFIEKLKKRDALERDEFESLQNLNIISDADVGNGLVDFHNLISIEVLKHRYRVLLLSLFVVAALLAAIILSIFLSGAYSGSAGCSNVNVTTLDDVSLVYGCRKIDTLNVINFNGFLEMPFVSSIQDINIWQAGNKDMTNISFPSLATIGKLFLSGNADNSSEQSQLLIDMKMPNLMHANEIGVVGIAPDNFTVDFGDLEQATIIRITSSRFEQIDIGSLSFCGELTMANVSTNLITAPNLKNVPVLSISSIIRLGRQLLFDFPNMEKCGTCRFSSIYNVSDITMPKLVDSTNFRLESIQFLDSNISIPALRTLQDLTVSGCIGFYSFTMPVLNYATEITVENTLSFFELSFPSLVNANTISIVRNLDLRKIKMPQLKLVEDSIMYYANIGLPEITLELFIKGTFIMSDCSAVTSLSLSLFQGPAIVVTQSSGLRSLSLPSLSDAQLVLVDTMNGLLTISHPVLGILGGNASDPRPLSTNALWYIARYDSSILSIYFAGIIINRAPLLGSYEVAPEVLIGNWTEFYFTNNNALVRLTLSNLTGCYNMVIGDNSALRTLDLKNLARVTDWTWGLFVGSLTSVEKVRGLIRINSTSLVTFDVLPQLTNVVSLQLGELTTVTSISLPLLESVDNIYSIFSNPLVSTLSTPVLKSVFSLDINNNPSLCVNATYPQTVQHEMCYIADNDPACSVVNDCTNKTTTPLPLGRRSTDFKKSQRMWKRRKAARDEF